MELLLIRHGEARRVGDDGITTDRQRVLSSLGIEKTRNAGIALSKLGLRINAVLSSPYPRTVQTSEILRDSLSYTPQIRASELVAPNAAWVPLVEELQRNIELRTIAVCGHEPDLSAFATKLLGGNRRASLIFHTGSVALFHVDVRNDPPEASLRWFLDSNQLDLIARAT